MRSASVPDPAGSGDHLDQHTGDPVRRLRAPGAGAVPWQDRTANPIAPARSRHWPRSGRPGVRREYNHQPDAPAASCVAPCAFAAVRDIAGRLLLVRRCDTGDWELPGGHVGDQVETSDARWFITGDIPALPIRPAMRLRIGHALTPGRPCHIG